MSASAPTDTVKSPTLDTTPESPTTARPLEMDDDDVQETGITGDDASASKLTTIPLTSDEPAAEEVPPPKPPRPVTEAQKNEQILKEAFPSVELTVIRAVLTASGGRIEPAFHALLQMTDPDAAQQDVPPPPPPRPAQQPDLGPTSTDAAQLEADELYARQLAEHYENVGAYEARTSGSGSRGYGGPPRGRQQTGLKPNEMYEREHSFIDDDLPVIRENLRKGFVETQTKVGSWFSSLKKRIDEQFDDHEEGQGSGAGGASGGPFMGRPTRDQTRRSTDYERYDADPELLSDDFAGMKFHADGTPVQGRQATNPNLFKPPPPSKSPRPADGRKVAFREAVEDIDAYDASPRLPAKDTTPTGSATKASKWQPLSTVDPNPIVENDPFSLGDSEDEKDAKTSNKEIKMEDTERLKQATSEAMAESLVDDKPKTGEAAEKKD